jgi:uncharacterized protein
MPAIVRALAPRLGALLCLVALAVPAVQAQVSLSAGGVPPPPVLAQHVTDLTGTLQAADRDALEQQLVALEQRKGSQVAILMVPSTGDTPVEQYALQVAEKNKLGRVKVDDGLLLLVAKDDHKARIEVGYGLEGVVTDAISSRVIREYLAPKFRQDDYAGGLRDATAVLVKLVDGEPLPPPLADEPAAQREGGGSAIPFAVMVGMFVGMFAGATRLKPVLLRRLGAGGAAAGLAWLLLSAGFGAIIAFVVAFLVSSAGGGRFGSGRGPYGMFPGGWGGGGFGGMGGGGGGGGGWSGGGGSFGGGGASGGW